MRRTTATELRWVGFLVAFLVVVGASAAAEPVERQDRFRILHGVAETLADRDLTWDDQISMRIGVMEAQDRVRLTAAAPFTVEGGGTTLTVAAGSVVGFTVALSKAAERRFWPVVETVPEARAEDLAGVVDAWQERGHRVTVFPAGAKLRYRGQLVHDNRRWFVAVEPTATETDAEGLFGVLQSFGARPWVYETLDRPATGVMELRDASGVLLGSFTGPARIRSAKPVKVFQVEFAVGYPWHGFEDREFRGVAEVRIDKVGRLQLVSELDIESYLQGVVPSEMSSNYPHEALCAQAVAARGETMAKYGIRHQADPYDLCAEQHCQVYSGLSREHPNTNAAVGATRGRILRHGDLIADTVYSACCGGHTEHNDNVWSTNPSGALRGCPDLAPGAAPFPTTATEAALKAWFEATPDAWCSKPVSLTTGRFRWRQTFSRDEVSKLVAARYPSVGTVRSLVPVRRGVSGRIIELRMVGAGDTAVIVKELPIRQLFGGLKSAAFVVETKGKDAEGFPTSFTFVGGGWGHGVGMCQWGARGQADAGRSWRTILAHYFADTQVLDVYRLPLRRH